MKPKILYYIREHGKSRFVVRCECGTFSELFVWSGRKRCRECGKLLRLGTRNRKTVLIVEGE